MVVLLTVASEEETYLIEIDLKVVHKIRDLLKKGMEKQEWPKEVNALLNKGKRVETFGTVSTAGDGWGWYENL